MGKIKFLRGLRTNYDPIKYQDYLYFASDSKEILMNGESYGVAYEGAEFNAIISVVPSDDGNSLVITDRYNNVTTITIPRASIPLASTDEDGLMSKEDKALLNELDERLSWIEIPTSNN